MSEAPTAAPVDEAGAVTVAQPDNGKWSRPDLQRVLSAVPLAAIVLVIAQFRRGGNSVIRQHDVLDSYQAVMNRLSLGDLFALPGHQIDGVLGGLDRNFFPSEFHIGNLITVIFPTVWSMAINELLIRSIAFVGMTWLLRSLQIGSRKWIVYTVATLFSLLPFYTPAFGAAAAVPLLFVAMVRIGRQRSIDRTSFAVLAGFPLLAEMPVTLPYVGVLLVAIAWLRLIDRDVPLAPLLKGVGILFAAMVVAGWRTLYLTLSGPLSHRAEMISARPWNKSMWDGLPASVFNESQHIFLGKNTLLGLVIFGGLLAAVWRPELTRPGIHRLIVGCVGLVMFGVLVERIWPVVEANLVKSVFDDWGRFQMSRVRWMEPTVVYVLLAISLTLLADLLLDGRPDWAWLRYGAAVSLALGAAFQANVLVAAHPFRATPDSLSIRAYYAEGTFAEIDRVFQADGGSQVVSVGLHPAVAIYNGLPSADGYWNGLPLDYKHRFRVLIAPALEQDPSDRAYFDNWGSRAYVFQPAFGRPAAGRAPRIEPFDLVVDVAAFEDLGISHVISAGEILNTDEVGLELRLAIDNPVELGRIYLYRLTS